MEKLFITTVNLSLAASVLGLVLLGIRALLSTRLPRWVFYLAWVLVAVRLLLPVSLTSDYSFFNLIPANVTDSSTQLAIVGDRGEVVNFPTVQPTVQHDEGNPPAVTVAPAPVPVVTILATVWLCGVLLFTGYSLLCYGYTRRRLARGEPLERCAVGRRRVAVVRCTLFASPVVCGVLRPVIVLPDELTDTAAVLVLSHECTHIRRCDNLWQGLATLLLYLHWWNPLMWLFHRCFVADMEISCDQAVCRLQEPRSYAATLVELSQQNSNRLAGGFLAFGESFLAERVRAVLRTHRMGTRAALVVLAVALGLVVVFLTNPSTPPSTPESVSPALPIPSSSSADSHPAVPPPESELPASSSAGEEAEPLPTVSYREGNPDWLHIDPAAVQEATLIDKENYLAVRLPTQELYTVVQLLNNLEPVPYEGTLDGGGNLRMLQLRMTSGDKHEYYLYPQALKHGGNVVAADSGIDSLYERLPYCGRLGEAGWGNQMPEWLGYMNPLRISGVTLQSGGKTVTLTTQDSSAARDDILWLANELCAVDTPEAGERMAEGVKVNDNAGLSVTMTFMDSDDHYTIELYSQANIICIKADSMGYTLAYNPQAPSVERLIKTISERLLGQ